MSRVLIGCECSGRVRRAFIGRGHDAYSCDLKPAEDVPPSDPRHYQCDVFDAIEDGPWDIIILHPECTAMALSGNRHYAAGMPKHQQRIAAIDWTLKLWSAATEACDRVALENPASVIFPELRKVGAATQFIHPHQFGHPEFKATGLALNVLPDLVPTDPLKVPEKGTAMYREWEKVHRMPPSPDRATNRSRTYLGIADAMASQWG